MRRPFELCVGNERHDKVGRVPRHHGLTEPTEAEVDDQGLFKIVSLKVAPPRERVGPSI